MSEKGHTTPRSIRASVIATSFFCIASSSCAKPPAPPPKGPPPRQILVTSGRVALRSSAYVELHAWLASSARDDEETLPSDLEAARRAYRRSLENDDDDALFQRTARALGPCTDDRCAHSALVAEGFGASFDRAIPSFTRRDWPDRAARAWVGVEAAHAALGIPAEAIFVRAASDLGVAWPSDSAVPIDIVSEAPSPARAAFMPPILSTGGPCFAIPRVPEKNVEVRLHLQTARIMDCVLVHALLEAQPTALRVALVQELGVDEGERAWTLLVIHSVAATVTGWEAKHVSPYRRSATAIEPALLDWLVKEWHGTPNPADARTFATRYAAEWRRTRESRD